MSFLGILKKRINPDKIIKKYYSTEEKAYKILIQHSEQVKNKALKVAKRVPELKPDLKFIEEAAMVHDIGMKFCKAPELGCNGNNPYIAHGDIGRNMLVKEGFPEHARVCERHIGVGITLKEIRDKELPLQKIDLIPETVEEKIICFADKFFSKNPEKNSVELTIDDIKKDLAKHGQDKVKKFEEWCVLFKEGHGDKDPNRETKQINP